MKPYADTNFFTRFYLDLPDSFVVMRLINEARKRKASSLPVTWLHRIELCNALQFHVLRGAGPGRTRVTPEQAGIAWARFQSEVGTRMRPATISNEEVQRQAEELSLRHTARHGFRTYDVIHVSLALLLDCDTFWSFDLKASKLANLEGLALRREN